MLVVKDEEEVEDVGVNEMVGEVVALNDTEIEVLVDTVDTEVVNEVVVGDIADDVVDELVDVELIDTGTGTFGVKGMSVELEVVLDEVALGEVVLVRVVLIAVAPDEVVMIDDCDLDVVVEDFVLDDERLEVLEVLEDAVVVDGTAMPRAFAKFSRIAITNFSWFCWKPFKDFESIERN